MTRPIQPREFEQGIRVDNTKEGQHDQNGQDPSRTPKQTYRRLNEELHKEAIGIKYLMQRYGYLKR